MLATFKRTVCREAGPRSCLISTKHITKAVEMERRCEEAASIIKKAGINFVGIDFDRTFISRHTGGRWVGSVEELAMYTRPEFAALVPALLGNGLLVAIVTFSGQTEIIQGVLNSVLGAENGKQIVIRSCDGTWGNVGIHEGKQKYLESAAAEFQKRCDVKVTGSTTLLIDDDSRNISMAMSAGINALWFNPHDPEKLLDDLASFQLLRPPSEPLRSRFACEIN